MDDPIKKINICITIAIAICCGMLSEFIGWFLVYKTEEFLTLNEELKTLYEQMQKEKEEGLISKIDKSKGKKKKSFKELYIEKNKNMNYLKKKINVICGILFIIVIRVLNSLFEGLTIAILPFKPIFPLSLITHSGLREKSIYHCSSTFIYAIILMLTRQNIQNYFDFATPTGMFGDLQNFEGKTLSDEMMK